MLIIVEVPTDVGILTFMSMINTTSQSLKARKFFIFQHFVFHEQLKFHAQLCLGAWSLPKIKSHSTVRKFPCNDHQTEIWYFSAYGIVSQLSTTNIKMFPTIEPVSDKINSYAAIGEFISLDINPVWPALMNLFSCNLTIKAAYSVTMNIFRKFLFSF